jgi:hypothetical protein
VLLGVPRERLRGGLRVHTQKRREPVAAPLGLEHTRMVGRQQPGPPAALEPSLLRELALGSVLRAPMLPRIVPSACQPEDQRRFRQARLRKLAKKRDATIGRVEDEDAHEVIAPWVPNDVEIGRPSVGIDDLPVIHSQEAPIYLTLLALHAEARVALHTASSGRPGPSSLAALNQEQSSRASRCTHGEGYRFALLHSGTPSLYESRPSLAGALLANAIGEIALQ